MDLAEELLLQGGGGGGYIYIDIYMATITSNLIDRGNDVIVIVFQKCDGGL